MEKGIRIEKAFRNLSDYDPIIIWFTKRGNLNL
jgi:hypothetical protein